MICLDMDNIKISQIEYQELVLRYQNFFNNEGFHKLLIVYFLDELKSFWLKRIKIIEFELEEVTENNTCFVLCGAVYLNLSDYEHFYFASLGTYHFLLDPFLKLDVFFRRPEIDNEIFEYFQRVFVDTVKLLENHQNQFYILPLSEIVAEHSDTFQEIIRKGFEGFISSAFDLEFSKEEDFCAQYQSFEEIEQEMAPYFRDNLIFSDFRDKDLSLREKIGKYCENIPAYEKVTKDFSDPERFLNLLYSLLAQVLDSLLICLYLRLNPYIRFEVPFNYLCMLMYTYIEDATLRRMIEKTIVFYILRKTISVEIFQPLEFTEYYKIVNQSNLLESVLKRMEEKEINIFEGGINIVEMIIQEEFNQLQISR